MSNKGLVLTITHPNGNIDYFRRGASKPLAELYLLHCEAEFMNVTGACMAKPPANDFYESKRITFPSEWDGESINLG